jgi:tryptophan 2,3-dioxygenase
MLEAGTRYQFFPELWAIRDQMTDNWGATYGVVRDSLNRQQDHAAA